MSKEAKEEYNDNLKSIVFQLNNEEYALPVSYVGAIETMMPITRVPGVPKYVKGVFNLRGVVTPIIDLRERFGFSSYEVTDSTRIIILQINDIEVGLIVDAAYDVVDIPRNTIEPSPEVIGSVQVDYIHGVAKLKDRLLILLDMEKVLNQVEVKEPYQTES
ncbi:Chemotaxis protein CheW [Paraliobacillus sp. PM-2]|uniref:chemotaxis protein CheW n=1 Tax=Paraliobacillus sp. PM-2 TaxID=1462524 RepID=UPI00061C88B1|nr:chemotaxis protein CheW [Paraliobacillus sp. PM-2]CQR47677.1 Chemotaxis protein CheW [Paraliobacillus sp. PM-2]